LGIRKLVTSTASNTPSTFIYPDGTSAATLDDGSPTGLTFRWPPCRREEQRPSSSSTFARRRDSRARIPDTHGSSRRCSWAKVVSPKGLVSNTTSSGSR